MADAVDMFRKLLPTQALHLPLPGAGDTGTRHRALVEFGRQDLSLGRFVEAHTDALAILAEADQPAGEGAWYGVWASEGPRSKLEASPTADGWRLSGMKQYCSGAPYVTTALVTARGEGGVLLFKVDMDQPGIKVEPSIWKSVAFEDTKTGPVSFDKVYVPSRSLVRGVNWYLERTGFWHGALGPAACWAGGACCLIEAAERLGKCDPYGLADRGALASSEWALRAYLAEAGREIDATPKETSAAARHRALKVRHLIERQCTEVLDRFGRSTGPQLLAYDDFIARQHQALALYIRQCHGERDLAEIPGAASADPRN